MICISPTFMSIRGKDANLVCWLLLHRLPLVDAQECWENFSLNVFFVTLKLYVRGTLPNMHLCNACVKNGGVFILM